MAIEALKDDTVIVFIDGSNLYDTPEPVQEAMTSGPALGSALPIIATFDSAIENLFGVVGYSTIKKADGFTELKAALAKFRGKDGKLSEASQKRVAELAKK